MLLLADLFNVKFWMVKEENFKHTILVEDIFAGTSALFTLETLAVLESNLDSKTLRQVKNDLREFRRDFIDYWNSMKRQRA